MASGTPWKERGCEPEARTAPRTAPGGGGRSVPASPLSKRLWSERAGDASAPRWRPAPRVPQHRARGLGGPFQHWHCWRVWGGGAQVHRPAHASSTLQDGDQRKPGSSFSPRDTCTHCAPSQVPSAHGGHPPVPRTCLGLSSARRCGAWKQACLGVLPLWRRGGRPPGDPLRCWARQRP